MTEEESSSVFGGLADAAGAAWDATVNVAGAAVDAGLGVTQFEVGMGEHALATGAELVGAQDTRDALDDMAVQSREASYDQFGSAGSQLSDAYTDVVGE